MNEERLIDVRNFLFELLQIETVSGEEIGGIKYIESVFKDLGFTNITMEHAAGNSFNLIINDVRESKLAIITHIDTIPIIRKPEIIDKYRVAGTGAVDAKGSIAAIYATLNEIESIPREVSIVILSLEETSGGGSIKYLETHKPKWSIVMEPTDLNIAFSSNGFLEVKIVLHGEHYHPDMLPLIPDFEKKRISTRLVKLLNTIDKFAKSTNLNYCTLKVNTVGDLYATPDKCELMISISIPPNKKSLEVYNKLKKELCRIDEAINIKIHDLAEPFITEDREFKESCLRAYYKTFKKKPNEYIFPSWTDATNLYEHGASSAIFGPGKPELAHTRNEHIDIRDVLQASKFLVSLINMV